MTVFLPAPDRLRPGFVVLGPDVEEEYAAPPLLLHRDVIKGPGIAEIKPHTNKQIGKAHSQLKNKKVPPGGEALIVTYLPRGRTTASGTPVDVYAVRYKPSRPRQPDTKPSEYLKNEVWWYLGRVNIPPTITVSLDDLSVFGSAAEQTIRGDFARILRGAPHNRPSTRVNIGKSPNRTGADIEWTEIAEMYAELARTTHDEFLAELADELAALG